MSADGEFGPLPRPGWAELDGSAGDGPPLRTAMAAADDHGVLQHPLTTQPPPISSTTPHPSSVGPPAQRERNARADDGDHHGPRRDRHLIEPMGEAEHRDEQGSHVDREGGPQEVQEPVKEKAPSRRDTRCDAPGHDVVPRDRLRLNQPQVIDAWSREHTDHDLRPEPLWSRRHRSAVWGRLSAPSALKLAPRRRLRSAGWASVLRRRPSRSRSGR